MAAANPEAENIDDQNLPAATDPAVINESDSQGLTRRNENQLSEDFDPEEEEGGGLIVQNFRKLSRPRQIQLIISVAATISMMLAIFIWSPTKQRVK